MCIYVFTYCYVARGVAHGWCQRHIARSQDLPSGAHRLITGYVPVPEEKVESLLKLSGNHGIFLQRLAVDGVAPEIDWLARGDDLSRDYSAQVFGEGQGKKLLPCTQERGRSLHWSCGWRTQCQILQNPIGQWARLARESCLHDEQPACSRNFHKQSETFKTYIYIFIYICMSIYIYKCFYSFVSVCIYMDLYV